jgi:uncharacterized protein (TIGR03083 family)
MPSGVEFAERVMRAALDRRPAGAMVPSAPPLDATALFSARVESLVDLLRELDATEWRRPALRGLDVRGLVGHLVGVERDFAEMLEGEGVAHGGHVDATEDLAGAAGELPHEAVIALLVSRGAHSRALATSADPRRPVDWYGVRLPLGQILVVRAFELWTHEEDIRRATGRPLVDPDPASLQVMTDLALELLPFVLAARPGTGSATARVVLIGAAGGTYDLRLGAAHSDSRAVRVVAETATFCRLVAARVDDGSVALEIPGDERLAAELFDAARSLALD